MKGPEKANLQKKKKKVDQCLTGVESENQD